MNKQELRRQQAMQQAMRVVFVGCQFCGATDRPLRNFGAGKICPECMKKQCPNWTPERSPK